MQVTETVYRYGVSIQNRGFILHFGIRFFELWLIDPSKMKYFKKLFSYRFPSQTQCIYSLDPSRKLVKHFFGYTTLKEQKCQN